MIALNHRRERNSSTAISKDSLSIVHILDSLEVGGMERTVVRLALSQLEAGHKVQVVTLLTNGPLAKPLDDAGVRVTCLNKKPGFDFALVNNLRTIATKEIEIIHTHNIVPHYYATLATLGKKVRRINTRHDMGMHLKGRRMNYLYRLSLLRTDAAIAVCEAAKARFVSTNSIPPNLISVINNGIPATDANKECSEKSIETKKQLNLPTNGTIVGSVGRLNAVKDYGTLIRAFSKVQKEIPDAKLVIIGDGPERNELQTLIDTLKIGESVTLLGERNDIEKILKQIDVFALTSLTEGFSVALVEAAWAGLATIATDVGGNREIVLNNTTGFLAEPKNIDDIESKIKTLLKNKNLRETFGERARLRAQSNWTVEKMRESYELIYKS